MYKYDVTQMLTVLMVQRLFQNKTIDIICTIKFEISA